MSCLQMHLDEDPGPKLEKTHVAEDGTERKSHYGKGRQPWDDFVDWGWGPHFAAANVVKYLRRTKDDPNDLTDARWYYTRLIEKSAGECNGPWSITFHQLEDVLTQDERVLLRSA